MAVANAGNADPKACASQGNHSQSIYVEVKEGSPLESVCVVACTRRIVDSYKEFLSREGFECYEVRRDAAEQREKPGVRVATMHRIKGLEFDHIIVASANSKVIPWPQALLCGDDVVARRNAETSERALLYVALTRARRSALVTAHGSLSPFLEASQPQSGATVPSPISNTSEKRGSHE